MAAPPPADVALRALSLQAFVLRAQIEQDGVARPAERPRWSGVLSKLSAWLDEEGVRAALTPAEAALLSAVPFSWSADAAKDAVWRLEGLAALLWTLSALPALPSFDDAVSVDVVDDALPPLRPTLSFVKGAGLRPAAEIDALRRTAGIWAWRAKTELLRRRKDAADDGKALALRGVAKAREAGVVDVLVEGDLPVAGRPFFAASTTDVLFAATIAHERSHALEWVLGKRAWSDEGAEL